MNTFALVRRELAATSWSDLRINPGVTAADVPAAVLQLLQAQDEDDAESAYWRIDNNCVVQGQLFDSAPPLVAALLAALATPLPAFVKVRIADLLAEVVCGESDESEVARGNPHLGRQARTRAWPGLWLIYQIALDPDSRLRERGLVIAHAVDIERERVDLLLEFAQQDLCDRVARLAGELAR